MNKEYWLSKWQNNEIGFNQQQPSPFLLKYLNHLNLKPGARIFVPLCGKSIDMLWLAQLGFQIIGVELSLTACQMFYTEHNLPFQENEIPHFRVLSSENITLLSGDFFDLNKQILGPIDAIYDRAALVALPTEMRRQYAKMIIHLTEPHTQMLLITLSYTQAEMQGPPFSVDENEIQQLYSEHFSIKKLYNASIPNIAEHLRAKELKQAYEMVCHLQKQTY